MKFLGAFLLFGLASANYGGGGIQFSGPSYANRFNDFVPIRSFNQNIRGSAENNYAFESGNGIRQAESTVVTGGGASLLKAGSVQYTSPEGIPISLNWVADENGFRPQGAHLPVPPPMPAEIAATMHLHQGGHGFSHGGNYGGNSYSSAPAPYFNQPMRAPAPYAPIAPIRNNYVAPAPYSPPIRSGYKC